MALVGAGGVGAIIRATVFTVQYHQYASLAGTRNVYCRSETQIWTRTSLNTLSFSCFFLPAGLQQMSSGYETVVNDKGVTIYRFAQGSGKVVRLFANAASTTTSTNPVQITIPASLPAARPAKP